MEGCGFCPTGKLEKVLLATDRSLYSEGAIREAINFAKKCRSKLYVMTVIELFTEHETLGEAVYKLEEEEARKHLDSIMARARAEGVDCEDIVHFGDNPHQLVVEAAKEKAVDLIVVGRRGTTGLKKLLMGEVASKVIGYAPCDVLVVPRAAVIKYEHLLVATDGSEHAKAAVKKAVDIAGRCGGGIIALSAMRDESEQAAADQYVNDAAEVAHKAGVPVETMTPAGKPQEVIVETAGGRGVDLIVMGTYGKTGIRKALMGSATEKVIGNAGCGVLVVK